MAKKKPVEERAASELEREVDELMDPRLPEASPAPEPAATESSSDDESDEHEKVLVIDNSDEAPEETSEAADDSVDAVEPSTEEANDMDDAETAAAIDQISRDDSDKLLASESGATYSQKSATKKAHHHKKFWRVGLPIIILVLIGAALAVPTSRFWIFNRLAMHGQASLTVVNAATGQPVEYADVTLGSQHEKTDRNGKVSFGRASLGSQQLTIKALAFATVHKSLTISLNQNQLGKFALRPTGLSYRFMLTDYLSGQPVVGGQVSAEGASAPSDTNGTAVITLKQSSKKSIEIKLNASGHNQKTVSVPASSSGRTIAVKLVPAGRDYFVGSHDDGYAVFSVNIDGTGKKTALADVGDDTSKIALAATSDGSLLAVVGSKQVDDTEQQTLTVINTATGQSQQLKTTDSIRLIGWVDGATLVFVSGKTCGETSCYELASYNYKTSARQELASSGNFVSVIAVNDRIYYVTGSDYSTSASPEFVATNADGTDRKVLLKQNIYSVYRTDYGKLDLAAAGQWYGYDVANNVAQKITAPESPADFFYVDSPSGDKAAWVKNSALMIYDNSSKASQQISEARLANYPLRWLDDSTIIYRSNGADYALNLAKGQPRKITNVVNLTSGNGF